MDFMSEAQRNLFKQKVWIIPRENPVSIVPEKKIKDVAKPEKENVKESKKSFKKIFKKKK